MSPETIAGEAAPEKPEAWLYVKILSARPLITIMGIPPGLGGFDEVAKGAPEVFDTLRGLHLLHIVHNLETGQAGVLAEEIAKAQKTFPGHFFLPLTATGHESYLLAQHGAPSLLANGLIFTDEKLWRPRTAQIPGLPMFDAVYTARLDPNKRHELAKSVDRLMLIYGYSLSQPLAEAYKRIRTILPNAFFANHRLADGIPLAPESVCRLYAHSRVGLCLSAVEGCMRGSMEYLLAGLPVVSTPSIGGRDRYFAAPYCRIVEADPDTLAGAVHELAQDSLDRRKIRDHVAQMIGFDRHNFMINVNKIAKLHLGRDGLIPSMVPMIGALSTNLPASAVIRRVRKEFATLQST
jgi:glycosyltransferase involved in cell wall biosynthesis